MIQPTVLALDDPEPFLRWIGSHGPAPFDVSSVKFPQIWALTGLAALARKEGSEVLSVLHSDPGSEASRFARAVGLEAVIEGVASGMGIEGRTHPIARVTRHQDIDNTSNRIARLLVPDEEESEARKTLAYVIIELLRNALQHSRDPLGGVVAAQRMDGGKGGYRETCVQVVVADAGIGVHEALRGHHPRMTDARQSLEHSLHPHISGTFDEGMTGSQENAGMGLFFISEMAKLPAGRFVIATRGAALKIDGDPEALGKDRIGFIDGPGLGFPGTLVAFELPVQGIGDYDALIGVIQKRASERAPQRIIHSWLRFEEAPQETRRIGVRIAAEDAPHAKAVAQNQLVPALVSRQEIALDFTGVHMVTQSFAHALLFEPLRIAWALKVPIYVMKAAPAVESALRFLESYALRG